MRLRNIPRAESTIEAHDAVINQPEAERGKWAKVFGNSKPIHIEIGMGKGQFLLNMALAHPDVNYIGIERYSSVLLRAVEKFDRDEYRELEDIDRLKGDGNLTQFNQAIDAKLTSWVANLKRYVTINSGFLRR